MDIADASGLPDAIGSIGLRRPVILELLNKMSDTQIIVALLLALIPAILAYRLGTALYQ